MRVLVVGGGAREHAISARLAIEPGLTVLCAPGNPGIGRELPVTPLAATDPRAVLPLADSWKAELTVVPMQNYRPAMWWNETGLGWLNP